MLVMAQREYIRYLRFHEGLSIRAIAKRLGCHRETVKRYLEDPLHEYTRKAPVVYPVLGPVRHIIDQWLENDLSQPPKQRHTARRIYQRLKDEYGFEGGETTVRDYVHKWRLAHQPKEVYLPLAFSPGESLQVDWGEIKVRCRSREITLYLFCARLAYSTAIFVRVYPHARMEAFLDGLQRALEFFGGVPREIVFDNLRTAVKRLVNRYEREETEDFLAFRTFYAFAARFCNIRKGNEKGLVENLVGYARRNFFVPMPEVETTDPQGLESLNNRLAQACLAARQQLRNGDQRTVAACCEEERHHLAPLPVGHYDCARRVTCKIDSSARVRFDTNWYSVPCSYSYQTAEIKAYVDRVEVVCQGKVIASHARCYGRSQQILELSHYLEVLLHKPGGLQHSRPWQQSNLPDAFCTLKVGQLRPEL